MGIDSPRTYGEYFWRNQVDATTAFEKAYEAEISGIASNVIDNLGLSELLPTELKFLLSSIGKPTGAYLGDIGGRFVSEIADGAVNNSASPFWDAIKYAAYSKFPTKKMPPTSTATLFSRGKITEDFFQERFKMEGYEPLEAKFVYDAMRAYPSIPELMLWARYHGDPENIRQTIWDKFDVDENDFELWQWFTYQKLTTDQILSLYKRGILSVWTTDTELAQIGWERVDRPNITELAYQLPNAMLTTQGNLLREVDDSVIIDDISKCDIHPEYAQRYLDAILTKPASQDIIAYQLRIDPNLYELDNELRKIGIHPNYFDLYKELAYPIPPVADIITMAVREAFTPEIATRFGQYEDFPSDFAKYAGMKGLTEEWAKRYWASHWSLPSPQQGFEMLHRGVISYDELNMLLRAQDIMPFWRDKLVQIAYRPLTRVDIRRMYQVGVLTEDEVYTAYTKLGYDTQNSRRMTDFTVKQVQQTLSKFSTTNVINAYKDRFISDTELRSLLAQLGIKQDDITNIIQKAEYRREWDFKADKIKAISNLYKKNEYSEGQVRSELTKLNLPSAEIDILLDRWLTTKRVEPTATWTAQQTLSFLKKGLINRDRAEIEFKALGYNDERIAIYLRSVD